MNRTVGYLVADSDRRYLTFTGGRLYYGHPMMLFRTRHAAVRAINRTRRLVPDWPELLVCHVDRVGEPVEKPRKQAVAKDGPKKSKGAKKRARKV